MRPRGPKVTDLVAGQRVVLRRWRPVQTVCCILAFTVIGVGATIAQGWLECLSNPTLTGFPPTDDVDSGYVRWVGKLPAPQPMPIDYNGTSCSIVRGLGTTIDFIIADIYDSRFGWSDVTPGRWADRIDDVVGSWPRRLFGDPEDWVERRISIERATAESARCSVSMSGTAHGWPCRSLCRGMEIQTCEALSFPPTSAIRKIKYLGILRTAVQAPVSGWTQRTQRQVELPIRVLPWGFAANAGLFTLLTTVLCLGAGRGCVATARAIRRRRGRCENCGFIRRSAGERCSECGKMYSATGGVSRQ